MPPIEIHQFSSTSMLIENISAIHLNHLKGIYLFIRCKTKQRKLAANHPPVAMALCRRGV